MFAIETQVLINFFLISETPSAAAAAVQCTNL